MQPEGNKTEKEFLAEYDPKIFDRPSTSVDSVIYTVFDESLYVLLIKRANHPFQNSWSLVGGFVDLDHDQDLEDTAKRKLKEKTGVSTPYLEQFGTVGGKDRDPRGWSISTVYFALIPADNVELEAGSGATEIKWSKVLDGSVSEKLAFDHAQILKDCTERLRNKVLYTSIPVSLMGDTFTLNELQKVYETIIGNKIEHKSFRRRILHADIIEETGEMQKTGRRPAALYRQKDKNQVFYFIRNLEGSHS